MSTFLVACLATAQTLQTVVLRSSALTRLSSVDSDLDAQLFKTLESPVWHSRGSTTVPDTEGQRSAGAVTVDALVWRRRPPRDCTTARRMGTASNFIL